MFGREDMPGTPGLRETPHLQRELGLARAPPLTLVLSDPPVELAVRLLQLGGRAGRWGQGCVSARHPAPPHPAAPSSWPLPGAHLFVTLSLFLSQLLHFEVHAEGGKEEPGHRTSLPGPHLLPPAHRLASASLLRSASWARRCRSASMIWSIASVRLRSHDCSTLATASSEAT